MLWVLIRSALPLMSTHNICFHWEIRKLDCSPACGDLIWALPNKKCLRACTKLQMQIILHSTTCHQRLCYIHSVVSNVSVSGQWMLWLDCTDAQADLGLCCLHIPKDVFAWHCPFYVTFLYHYPIIILNPLWTELTHSHYVLEDSNFDFWEIRLCDLDILREKWLDCLQTVEMLIRCHILQQLIWVCNVCEEPF